MPNQKYGLQSLARDFPNDDACLGFLFDTLHTKECSCGGEYRRIQGRKQYQCSRCRFQIAPTAGTIFHKSDTPLSLWFRAILMFSNSKSGVSAKFLQRELEVTYKTAWRIASQVRKALRQDSDLLNGVVETDVAYVGGRKSGGKNNEKLSEAVKAKSVVMVAIERGGKMRVHVRADAGAEEIKWFLTDNVAKGSILMTDSARVYERLEGFGRFSVNHSKKEYVRGAFHTNTVEGFFAHLKRSIRGTCKVISRKHLQSYLDAFVFHYNNRHSDRGRFASLLGAVLHGAR